MQRSRFVLHAAPENSGRILDSMTIRKTVDYSVKIAARKEPRGPQPPAAEARPWRTSAGCVQQTMIHMLTSHNNDRSGRTERLQ